MKKLDQLLLRSFLGPLLMTFAIAVFVLLMQFLWKYIDDMVGKGLEFSVIMELLLYASATFVPMALPIAVLFASIMTMGNFGERYELVAMKAGGISVRRIMMPMAIVAVLLTGLAFYFANNIMPQAMLHYRMTLYDITRKKPAVNIRPGEYYKDIEGYVIRVGSKATDGCTLEDVVIYDHTRGVAETGVIVASSGIMQTTPDGRQLLFTLTDGYTYLESTTGQNRDTRPFTSVSFDKQVIAFDISSFAFNRSAEDIFRGGYQMMNIAQLDSAVHRLDSSSNVRREDYYGTTCNKLRAWKAYCESKDKAIVRAKPAPLKPSSEFSKRVRVRASNYANTAINEAHSYSASIEADTEFINRHLIEKQRKYTLSVACLLLFLIGAPFGSIVRKGGLGLPLVASVAFFVLYYVVGMISEKAVRESALGQEGMWISTFVLLPLGLLLTLQATTDSSFFDASSWKKFFSRLFRGRKGVESGERRVESGERRAESGERRVGSEGGVGHLS